MKLTRWVALGALVLASLSASLVRDAFEQAVETVESEPQAALDSDEADFLTSSEDVLSEDEAKGAVAWQAPNFAGQVKALGWTPTTFETPPDLEQRVSFWRDIYTKYTSQQGVLHDRVQVQLIYEMVDFSSIMNDPRKSLLQKARAREKLVNQKRKEITERLSRLQELASPDGLTGDDLRYWQMYAPSHDPKRFAHAAEKGRVRFQLGQSDRFIKGIYHSGRYLRDMEEIFRAQSLPIELTRLPFVESSFNIHARSRAGASGVWQFMRRTARPLMTLNAVIDERNDPLRATGASARLLRQNYQALQSWPLAVTAYNHGSSGIQAIVREMKTRDISEIVAGYSSKRFGFASENFYACFLAALDVESHADKYFGEVKWGPNLGLAELRIRSAVPYKQLALFFDGNAAQVDLANPHLLKRVRKGQSSIPALAYLRVPKPRLDVADQYFNHHLDAAQLAEALRTIPMDGSPALAIAGAADATVEDDDEAVAAANKEAAKAGTSDDDNDDDNESEAADEAPRGEFLPPFLRDLIQQMVPQKPSPASWSPLFGGD